MVSFFGLLKNKNVEIETIVYLISPASRLALIEVTYIWNT